jgi:hypothetical protein
LILWVGKLAKTGWAAFGAGLNSSVRGARSARVR